LSPNFGAAARGKFVTFGVRLDVCKTPVTRKSQKVVFSKGFNFPETAVRTAAAPQAIKVFGFEVPRLLH
jgi:hypothetical protein